MRFKTILCSMAALALTGAMTSCSNEEAVKMPVENNGISINPADCQTVSLKIGVPGELRTRNDEGLDLSETPSMTKGTDGLWNFSRAIDKLWYGVYYKGNLLYNSFETGIPQAVYNSTDESFMLDLLIPKINEQINLSDYDVFFFAGNALDKVQQNEITDGIGLDFANKTMYAYPAILNRTFASGEIFYPEQYDYFAKYENMNNIVNGEFTGSVVLTRPFCQVSLLTDELVHAGVLRTYSSDGKVKVDMTPGIYSGDVRDDEDGEFEDGQTLPYAWNYGTDAILTKDLAQTTFTLNSRTRLNNLSIPQAVKFKNRDMYCIGSYLMLAPDSRKAYQPGSAVEKFCFKLDVAGSLNSTVTPLTTDVPVNGIKANEKYVIYNKQFDPTNPDDGGGHGIFSTHFVLDIVVDPTWENTNDITLKDSDLQGGGVPT